MGPERATGWLAIFINHPDFAAALVGIFLSWCATQFIKKQLPDSLSEPTFRRLTQCIGFVTGWFFAYGAWRLLDPTATRFENLYYAAGIGFASPAVYSLVVSYFANKYPWVEKVMSGRPGQTPPK